MGSHKSTIAGLLSRRSPLVTGTWCDTTACRATSSPTFTGGGRKRPRTSSWRRCRAAPPKPRRRMPSRWAKSPGPQFRGPHNGVVPGIVLDVDWTARPPKEDLAAKDRSGVVVIQRRGKSPVYAGAARATRGRRLLRRQDGRRALGARITRSLCRDHGRSRSAGHADACGRETVRARRDGPLRLPRSAHGRVALGARSQTGRAADSRRSGVLPRRRWLSATKSSSTPAVRTTKASWPTTRRRANSAGRPPLGTTHTVRRNWPPSPDAM